MAGGEYELSSVEQRIVEMKFDNDQFEKSARTSISTLEKLKSALNFGGSVKSLQDIEGSANRLNFNALSRSIDTINSRFSTLGIAGMTAISRITNAAIDCGSKLVNLVKMPLDQIATGGWNRASNIASAKFLIEGISDASDAWERYSQDIDYAVKGTAYGFDEAARVVAQFAATGIEAGKDMQAYARAVSGVAAMTNSSYSEIGHIFTTVSGQGKLMTEQLNQLAARGLNASSTLAKKLKVSEAELRKMVSDGKVDFDTFAKAMDEAFGEHAKDANKTFTGSLANMKAALSRIGAEFAAPIQDNMVSIFNAARVKIDEVNQALKDSMVHEDFTNFLLKASGLISEIISKIDLTWLYKLTVKLHEAYGIFDDMMSKLFPKWGKDFKTLTKENTLFLEELGTTASVATDEIEELAKQVIRGDFGNGEDRVQALADKYKLVQNRVNELLGDSFRYEIEQQAVTEAVEDTTKALNENQEATHENYKMFNGLLYAIKNTATVLKEEFLRTFTTGKARTKMNDFTSGLADGFDILGKIVGAFLEGINGPFAVALATIGQSLLDAGQAIGIWLHNLHEWMEENDAYTKIANVVLQVGFRILKVIRAVDKKIRWFLKPTTWTPVTKIILGLKKNITDFLSAFKKTEGFERISGGLEKVKEKALGLKEKAFDKISEWIKKFSNGEIKLPKFNAEEFAQKVSDKIVWLLDKIQEIKTAITDFFVKKSSDPNSIFSKIADFFKDFTVSGTVDKFVDLVGKAKTALLGLFKNIKIDDASKGLTGKLTAIKTALTDLFKNATDGKSISFKSFLSTITDLFGDAGKSIGDFLGDKATRLGEFIDSIHEKIPGLDDIFKFAYKIMRRITAFNSLRAFNGILSGIANLSGVLSGVSWFLKGEALDRASKALPRLAILIGVTAAAFKVLSTITWDQFYIAAAAIGVITAALVVLMRELGKLRSKKNPVTTLVSILDDLKWSIKSFLKGIGRSATMIAFSASISMLAGTVIKLSGMRWESAKNGLKIMAAVMAEFVVAMGFISLFSKLGGSVKQAITIVAMAASLKMVVNAFSVLAELDPDKVEPAVEAFGRIMVGFAGMMAVSKLASKSFLSIVAVAALMWVTADSIKKLDKMDPKKLRIIVSSIEKIFIQFVNFIKSASTLALDANIVKFGKKTSSGTLIAAAVALGALMAEIAGIFYLMRDMDAGSMVKMSKAFENVFNALARLALASSVFSGGGFASTFGGGAAKILLAGILGVVVWLMAWLNKKKPELAGFIESGLPLIESVARAIGRFIGVIIEEGLLRPLANTFGGVGTSLTEFLDNLMPFITGSRNVKTDGISALVDVFKMLGAATFMALVDSVLAWLVGKVNGDNQLGLLTDFASGMVAYSYIIENMKTDAVEKSEKAVQIVEELTRKIPNEGGALAVIVGDNRADEYGGQLFLFAQGLVAYSEEIVKLKSGAVIKSALAARTIIELTKSIDNQGGILGLIVGDNKADVFAKNMFGESRLESFAAGLVGYSYIIKSLDTNAVSNTVNAVATIIALTSSIDNQGGLLGLLAGDNKADVFARNIFGESRLEIFAKGFVGYANVIKDLDTTVVSSTTSAVEAIIALTKEVPATGGILGALSGNTVDAWAQNIFEESRLAIFAKGLVEYSIWISHMNTSAVTDTEEAVKTVIALTKYVPRTSGILGWLFGNNWPNTFGSRLKGFAEGLVTYSQYMGQMDTTAVVETQRAVRIIEKLSEDIPKKGLLDWIIGNDVGSFGSKLASFGEGLLTYALYVSQIDAEKITSVTEKIQDLSSAISSISDSSAFFSLDTAQSQLTRMTEVVGQFFDEFLSAFDNATVAGKIQSAGELFFNYISQGFDLAADTPDKNGRTKLASTMYDALYSSNIISSSGTAADKLVKSIFTTMRASINENETGATSIKNTIRDVIRDAFTYAKPYAEMFRSIGYAMMIGLAQGIADGQSIAINAAARAGENAVISARNAVGMNSPAKKFIEIGLYSMRGLAMGFTENTGIVNNAVTKVAETTAKTMNDGLLDVKTAAEESSLDMYDSLKAIYSYINELTSDSLDTQPKITPVMDLSNLQNGSYLMNKMLGDSGDYMLRFGGAYTNSALNGSNAMQNDNKAVVDSINLLRSDINNLSNAIANQSITLNDGTLVGKLAPRMSSELRILYNRGR